MQLFPSLLMQGVLHSNPLASGDCVCKEADINHHASTHTHTHEHAWKPMHKHYKSLHSAFFTALYFIHCSVTVCNRVSVSVSKKKTLRFVNQSLAGLKRVRRLWP